MKTTKRIAAAVLALVMVFALAACGGAEKTVTLRGDMSDATGMPTTDTWTMTAKGDIVQTLNEVLEFDLSESDDETIAAIESMMESTIINPANEIDGIECTGKTEDGVYTIELNVDCTGSAVSKAAEAGILTIDGTSKAISLKQTQASLEKQGYEVVE